MFPLPLIQPAQSFITLICLPLSLSTRIFNFCSIRRSLLKSLDLCIHPYFKVEGRQTSLLVRILHEFVSIFIWMQVKFHTWRKCLMWNMKIYICLCTYLPKGKIRQNGNLIYRIGQWLRKVGWYKGISHLKFLSQQNESLIKLRIYPNTHLQFCMNKVWNFQFNLFFLILKFVIFPKKFPKKLFYLVLQVLNISLPSSFPSISSNDTFYVW